MTRRTGVIAMAIGILLLSGCSASWGDSQPAASPTGAADGDGAEAVRPVLAPGTIAATGTFAPPGGVSGSVAIRVDDQGIFELVVSDLTVADGAAVQFTLAADRIPEGSACLEADWRFGLGQADAGHDPSVPLVLPIGGSDGIGQGDLSFIREVVVTRAPGSAPRDKNCPIPIETHAPLGWDIPDLRPGLSVADSGAVTGAMGEVTLFNGEPGSYTVAQGDTLATIAARFGISLDDLFYLNPRRSPNPEDAEAFTGEELNLSRDSR